MTEWYRKNAGIVVFNSQGKVLLCQRNDISSSWQFPQGGIEEGESIADAAKRELKEETSIHSAKLIKSLTYPARYRFTDEIIAKQKKRGFTNVGQDMFWSLFYFDGAESEINLQTEEPEFSAYKWGTLEEAYELIVDFKKPAYEVAVKEFSKDIAGYLR